MLPNKNINKQTSYDFSLLLMLFALNHSLKKGKDCLETLAVLLIFLLELVISGVAVQSIHQNSKKWQLLLGTAQ